MSMLARRLIICALGILGGAAVWPVMEWFHSIQAVFPGYLSFSLAGGAAFGLIFGAFFASAEGIIAARNRRIATGSAAGALIGAVGGAFGFLIAQGFFLVIGERIIMGGSGGEEALRAIGLPLTRAVGWGILGMFVGAAEGIRAASLRKTGTGVLGGLAGGVAGGAVLEYLRFFFPGLGLASLAGLMLFGLLIGIAYAIIERSLSFGVLRLLNGRSKGKEFILNQKKLLIGSGGKSGIILQGYRGVELVHALLGERKGELLLTPAGPEITMSVNDETKPEYYLKYEDVIKIGTAKFLYKHE